MADNFAQRLQRTMRFFEPENLSSLVIKYEGEVAMLIVDSQKQFCEPINGLGNEETVDIATRIGALTPEFRKASVPVYGIYYKTPDIKDPAFYGYEPKMGDMLVPKNKDSAFEGSNIGSLLKRDKKKLLLVCGFNLNACVKQTVLDARKQGFDVCVMGDITGNSRLTDDTEESEKTIQQMRDAGVMIAPSSDVLSALREKHPAAPKSQLLVVSRF